MSEPFLNVLEPASSVGLISLEDAKVLLKIAAGDISNDQQLQMIIDQNSMILASRANRDTFAKERVEERWDCVAPACCPDGTRKIWLMRAPVKPEDIESIESPEGVPLDPSLYRLEQRTGKIVLLDGGVSEIVITYSGGYDLPDDAPLDLQQMCGLMLRQYQTEAAAAATGGSGIRMLSHKDSRIMYYSPKDMAAGNGSSSSGPSMSDAAITSLIKPYTRYWI